MYCATRETVPLGGKKRMKEWPVQTLSKQGMIDRSMFTYIVLLKDYRDNARGV